MFFEWQVISSVSRYAACDNLPGNYALSCEYAGNIAVFDGRIYIEDNCKLSSFSESFTMHEMDLFSVRPAAQKIKDVYNI
ncbi:MAG: hypothetical protein DRP86_03540 [Candidatus Neomarinimicrobiota bacterium]|nr:MAG: hypothetical protein DRP86_03540 [Candidatus Neomarinimicrobiota bacterium]